jgi:hypothetical protein
VEPDRYPRVSKEVERVFEVVLTVIWLGGTLLFLEVMDTGWREPIVLLVGVVLVEVVFIVWNEGHLPKARRGGVDSPNPG